MRLRHVPAGAVADDPAVLATDVDRADTVGAKVRGLMGRTALPDDYALVFDFPRVGYRSIHMLLVRVPLDVIWLREATVVKTKTLTPWTGVGLARADRVVELPAGAASDVEVGDGVTLEE